MTSERGQVQAALRLLLPALPRGRLVLVLALMSMVSLTEGVGLFLLVPIVAAVGGGEVPAAMARVIAASGIAPRLEPLLACFVALIALRGAVQYFKGTEAQKLGAELVDRLRMRTLRALFDAEWRTLAAMRHSDATGIIISTLDDAYYAFMSLVGVCAAGITLAGTAAAAMAISWHMALLAAAGGAAVALTARGLQRRSQQLGAELQDAFLTVHAAVGESTGALRLIKVLRAEARAQDAIRDGFGAVRTAQLEYARSFERGQLTLHVAGAIVLALATWIAAARFGMDGAVLLPMIALFARAVPLLSALQASWQDWLHATPAITAAADLIAQLERNAEPVATAMPAPPLRRELVLDGVTVRHQGRAAPALNGISHAIPAGSIVAVTGPSGAGKSTLADLLCGLIEPANGSVMADGVPLIGPARRAWRRRVAYVQQEPVLFHATIRHNLAWALPDADEAAMLAALDAASAGFVAGLPDGLDTVVGDRGTRLSGGERQRIALARALLGNPDLLLLDEATSALDPANEAMIADAIGRLKGRMTIVMICHHGNLARLADHHIRLENGRLTTPAG